MSFSKRLRRALGGEDPRALDAQKEAADELRRAQTSARPGGPGPAGPPPGGPSPAGPASSPRPSQPAGGPSSGPATPPAGGPSPRPNPPSSPPPSSGRTTPPPSGPRPGSSPPPASPKPEPPANRGPESPASPAPEGPGIRSGVGAGTGGSGEAPPFGGGTAPPPFTAPSSGQELTPAEERQALNEMALEDLGGPAADGGGVQVNPVEAEAMRDRALAQYMQRKEEFDRLRERQAQRQARDQPEPQAEPQADGPAFEPKAQRQAPARSQSRMQARTTTEEAGPAQPEEKSVEDKLADVPGLGPAKIRALLKEFESFEELQQAGEEDLVQVTGIGQQLAREIVRNIR